MNSFIPIPPSPPFEMCNESEKNSKLSDFEGNRADPSLTSEDDDSMRCESPDLNLEELLEEASTLKTKGTDLFQNANFEEACKVYREALQKLKAVGEDFDSNDKEKQVKEMRVALNSNLSLCYMKRKIWPDTVKHCNAVLVLSDCNVKALFRRGYARIRMGMLEQAREDLIRTCKLDPVNREARQELKLLKEKEEEAKAKEKEAFKNLFLGGKEYYPEAERRPETKHVENSIKEAEEELNTSEAKVEDITKAENRMGISSQDSMGAQKASNVHARNGKSTRELELDEEDEKVIQETSKMGYCYFNRPLESREKELLAMNSKPVKLGEGEFSQGAKEATTPKPMKSISSWNQLGTTYEEKDCSTFAMEKLREKLKDVFYENKPAENIEETSDLLKKFVETKEQMNLQELSKSLTPFRIEISSVKTLEGDAHFAVVRGQRRFVYDFVLCVGLLLQIKNLPQAIVENKNGSGIVEYKGKLTFADLSSVASSKRSIDFPEPVADWLVDGRAEFESKIHDSHVPVYHQAIKMIKSTIYRVLKEFEDGISRSV